MLDPAQGSVGGCASSFCGGSRVSRQTHDSHTRETAVRLVVGSTNNVVLIDTNAPHVRCDYIVFAFRYIKRYRSTIVSPKRNLLDLTRTRTKLKTETTSKRDAKNSRSQPTGRPTGVYWAPWALVPLEDQSGGPTSYLLDGGRRCRLCSSLSFARLALAPRRGCFALALPLAAPDCARLSARHGV